MSEPIRSEEKVTDRYLTGMLLRFLAPYWLQLVIVFGLLLAVSALTLLLPYLIQRAVDGPIAAKNINGLIPYGIAYFVTILILFVARFAHTYMLQDVGQNALVAI